MKLYQNRFCDTEVFYSTRNLRGVFPALCHVRTEQAHDVKEISGVMAPVGVWLAAVYLHISIQTVEKLCHTTSRRPKS